MCLLTTDPTIKTAEQDITTFKVLFQSNVHPDMIRSQFHSYTWKLNVIHETEIKKSNKISGYILEDFLYYQRELLKGKKVFSFGKGFHSCFNPHYLQTFFASEKIFQCTIPKGSQYIEGYKGLVVSNKIIINHVY